MASSTRLLGTTLSDGHDDRVDGGAGRAGGSSMSSRSGTTTTSSDADGAKILRVELRVRDRDANSSGQRTEPSTSLIAEGRHHRIGALEEVGGRHVVIADRQTIARALECPLDRAAPDRVAQQGRRVSVRDVPSQRLNLPLERRGSTCSAKISPSIPCLANARCQASACPVTASCRAAVAMSW